MFSLTIATRVILLPLVVVTAHSVWNNSLSYLRLFFRVLVVLIVMEVVSIACNFYTIHVVCYSKKLQQQSDMARRTNDTAVLYGTCKFGVEVCGGGAIFHGPRFIHISPCAQLITSSTFPTRMFPNFLACEVYDDATSFALGLIVIVFLMYVAFITHSFRLRTESYSPLLGSSPVDAAAGAFGPSFAASLSTPKGKRAVPLKATPTRIKERLDPNYGTEGGEFL